MFFHMHQEQAQNATHKADVHKKRVEHKAALRLKEKLAANINIVRFERLHQFERDLLQRLESGELESELNEAIKLHGFGHCVGAEEGQVLRAPSFAGHREASSSTSRNKRKSDMAEITSCRKRPPWRR